MSTILRIVKENSMNRFFITVTVVAAAAAAFCTSGLSQTAEQPVTLIVEVDHAVFYRGDVTDPSKVARDPGVTIPLPARAFQQSQGIGDIIVVNGKPAKGLWTNPSRVIIPRESPGPGQSIADFQSDGPVFCYWNILGPDGSWIGTLVDGGMFPSSAHAIVGAAGAFLGVTGEHRFLETITVQRTASVTEDPANRRINGGGRWRTIFYLWPKFRPSVDVSHNGPAVFHADFSPVTAASPARPSEVLIVAARNLGPTRPELLPPGTRPFKSDPLEVVNSPIEVTVNGQDAEVINKVGWPGTSDLYRVDFRVPSGLAPGVASIQLTAAWIPGSEVKIPVQ